VCRILGQGTELYLTQLADRAGVNRSSLKNAAMRNSLSHDLAEAVARLFLDPAQTTIRWLRTGEGDPPTTPKKAAIRLAGPRSGPGAHSGTAVAPEVGMRAERAALAFQRTLEDAELYGGEAGGWVLHDILIELATLLAKHGAPNADLLDYAEELRGELKPRR